LNHELIQNTRTLERHPDALVPVKKATRFFEKSDFLASK